MGEFIIWLLIIGIFFMVINSFQPKEAPPESEKPKEKPEGMVYTDEFKAQIAVESFKGKSDADIIKEHPTVTAEEINEWKKDLADNIVNLSDQNEKFSKESEVLNRKVKRLEEICQIFIGDDWKEKTGYNYL